MLEAMVWAFDQRLGDAGAKFVLVTLADMANGDCVCWPSVNELAKRTDMGESTVRRHLKWLAKYPDLFEPHDDGTWTQYASDGPRYKALGNSMAVNVMRWLGERIRMVDAIQAAALEEADDAA